VLMGSSSFFSNGIHLNVIEHSETPDVESWDNINAIDDCVSFFPKFFCVKICRLTV
jgi:putative two-component system hydrogenase maturation factor HypX/HoxX